MMDWKHRVDRIRSWRWMGSVALATLLCLGGCSGGANGQTQSRPPAASGTFYPDNAKELNAMLKKALHNAPPPKLAGEVKGLLLPHAGYIYSGVITAIGMKALVKQELDTVYIIGTSHYANVGGALVWKGKSFRTPLGEYPVDVLAIKELLQNCPDIHVLARAWEKEHSVEVQVPFLQKIAPQAKLVPLVMGTSSEEECWAVAQAIGRQAAKRKAVIIASTDLSHYPSYADARFIDNKMLESVKALDPQALDQWNEEIMARGISNLACTVCGLSALKTTMIATNLMGANRGQLLHYANSGDIGNDRQRVVGYAALAFIHDPKIPQTVLSPSSKDMEVKLTPEQKKELLRIARAAITEGLATRTQMKPTTSIPVFLQKYPVFVTLKRGHQLRGCIGMTEPRLPLYQGVANMACAAAFNDPRFQPLGMNELQDLEIEISVLSGLQRIQDPSAILLGVHGVVVKRSGHSGLFLPQVATETGWTKEEFLNQLCSTKADLPSDSWRDKQTELYIFRVQSFSEAEFSSPGR